MSKFSTALDELEEKIDESKGRQRIINEIVEKIRNSEVQVAKKETVKTGMVNGFTQTKQPMKVSGLQPKNMVKE